MPADAPHLALGIDIGGTFTDLILYEQNGGTYKSHKQLTTPDDPTEGVIAGLRHLADREGLAFSSISRVVHATTLFTNALIERKGAATGLLTTAGFRDLLEIARERKYELYDIFTELPAPLVRRSLRLEVPERLAPSGAVETPLDRDALVRQARTLIDDGVQSIAIVFLHAYANAAHERLARDELARCFPGIFVSISSDVAPQIREYERASTTVANAYIKPLASRYVGELGRQARRARHRRRPIPNAVEWRPDEYGEAQRNPIQMLESGPAAGALVGAYFGTRSDMPACARLRHGRHHRQAVRHRGWAAAGGLQLRGRARAALHRGLGTADQHLHRRADRDRRRRRLDCSCRRAGPPEGRARKAPGASPGPACYQRGGERPTVTDANLVLGYLDAAISPAAPCGSAPRRRWARSQRLARAIGLDVIQTAWGVHNLVNETMAERRARAHLRAGPRSAPLCAADDRRRRSAARLRGRPQARHRHRDLPAIRRRRLRARPAGGADAHRSRAHHQPGLRGHGPGAAGDALPRSWKTKPCASLPRPAIDPATAVVTRLADMRYAGQGFELVVKLPGGPYGADAGPGDRGGASRWTTGWSTPARRQAARPS